MLSFLFFSLAHLINSLEPRPRLQETVRERLKRLYQDHKVHTDSKARTYMYNDVDCDNNQIVLIYSGTKYQWKCHQTIKPDGNILNAEHLIPQSTFGSKTPMVSDLHSLVPAASGLNNRRSNYNFTEVDYSQCKQFCRDMTCQTTMPEDPDSYSCLTNSKTWMPIKQDRGRIARAVFYFYTMYPQYPISVGDVNLFKRWNLEYPPSSFETLRNDRLNETQGNRNPYIDDPTLVDQAFP